MSLHVTEARDIKNTALNVIRCQTKKSKERSIDLEILSLTGPKILPIWYDL